MMVAFRKTMLSVCEDMVLIWQDRGYRRVDELDPGEKNSFSTQHTCCILSSLQPRGGRRLGFTRARDYPPRSGANEEEHPDNRLRQKYHKSKL